MSAEVTNTDCSPTMPLCLSLSPYPHSFFCCKREWKYNTNHRKTLSLYKNLSLFQCYSLSISFFLCFLSFYIKCSFYFDQKRNVDFSCNQLTEREYMISSGDYVKSMANAVIIGVSLTFKRMINATDLTSMHHMNKYCYLYIISIHYVLYYNNRGGTN